MLFWRTGPSISTRQISVRLAGLSVGVWKVAHNHPDNAYVSGVQEDLGLHGNDLVQLQTLYTLGAVLGQIPFAYLFTKYPMSFLIPLMDILWGIFTLLQFRVTSYSELAAYRFLVGWFEVS